MAKERNYMYDAIRGVCMFLIPLQHFIDNAGLSGHGTFGGLIYVTVDIFTLPIFFFISGMFSKKAERGREIAFGNILWPALVSFGLVALFAVIEAAFEYANTGSFQVNGIYFPLGMWFMVVLFAYRFFHKNLVKIPYLIGVCFIVYLFSGFTDLFDSNVYGKARLVNYLLAFILGYYMTQEQVAKLRCLKIWQTILLGIMLITASIVIVWYMPESYSYAANLRDSYAHLGIQWWAGMIYRVVILLISIGWFVFLANILQNKKGFWAWIGMNTMPIYMFHLMIAKAIEEKGSGLGLFDLSDRPILNYIWIFAFSTIVTILLATKPAGKVYEFLVDGSYKVFMTIISKGVLPVLRIAQKPFDKLLLKLKDK